MLVLWMNDSIAKANINRNIHQRTRIRPRNFTGA
jgi:hypothetical protein